MTLGEPKRAVYGPETAFLVAREGGAFLKEDAISFFIGDTDPGNFSTFQKQSLCFSGLLCFISTFLFFSKWCSQLQTYLRERGEWMPAYTLASTRVLPFCWLYKLQTSHRPARKWPKWKAICKREISWLKLLTGGRGSWTTCRGLDRELGDKRMLQGAGVNTRSGRGCWDE